MADLKMEADPRFRKHGIPDSIKLSHLQNLLHEALIATNHVYQCALFNRFDGTLIITSAGFKLSTAQIQVFLGLFQSPHLARESGFQHDNIHYQCLRADNASIYAKSTSGGMVLVRTETLILMAAYSENMYPSVCIEAVEKLADYFREKGK